VPALEWLARWMNDKQGLKVFLEAHGQLERPDEDLTILLFQATRELLFNVVKHAQVRSAHVRLENIDGTVQIAVSDDGVGFDAEKINKETLNGGGFGLFSIRERLELMGGRMEVDSAPGQGTTFHLIVPVPEPEMEAAEKPSSEISVAYASSTLSCKGSSSMRIRVVLVDDHLVMRQGLGMLVRDEEDMEVIGEASDGESAIELIRQLKPDVVLMDISMPGMTGIDAARIIHAELPEVRIIGLSMFDELERAQAMMEVGASAYLSKSGPAENLLATIRNCASAKLD